MQQMLTTNLKERELLNRKLVHPIAIMLSNTTFYFNPGDTMLALNIGLYESWLQTFACDALFFPLQTSCEHFSGVGFCLQTADASDELFFNWFFCWEYYFRIFFSLQKVVCTGHSKSYKMLNQELNCLSWENIVVLVNPK